MWKRQLTITLLGCLLLISSGMLVAQDNPDARVNDMASTLNLREAPSLFGAVIMELAGNTPLKLIGRTANNVWLKVEIEDGRVGWVSARFVRVLISLSDVPVLDEGVPSTSAATGTDTADAPADSPPGETTSARVMTMPATLRLRHEPSTLAGIIAELASGTRLEIIGRSEDGAWLNVTTPSGRTGWVSAQYVVFGGAASVPTTSSTSSMSALPPASSVRGVRNIYLRGQTLGNQRHVFTKIGDSITVSEHSLDAIGRNQYDLGGYGGLQRVIDTYMTGGFNSFTHVSAAAGSGWTTTTALEPQFRNTALCQEEVSAVECELDRVKPAVAMIQLGTNDLLYLSPDQFAHNIARIVDICIDKGVVPVLATIPHRAGFEDGVNTFNAIIRNVAASRSIPLWDVKAALDGLPDRGLSGDGVHPSFAPGGYADSANFANSEALQSGYVIRNLTALQALERVLSVMGG